MKKLMIAVLLAFIPSALRAENSIEAEKEKSGRQFKEQVIEQTGGTLVLADIVKTGITADVASDKEAQVIAKAVSVIEQPLNQDEADVLAYIKELTPEKFAALDPATKEYLKRALRHAAANDAEIESLESLGGLLKVPSYPLSVRQHWEGSQAQKSHISWVNKQKLVAWGSIVAAAALTVLDISTGGIWSLFITPAVIALAGIGIIQVLRLILGIPTLDGPNY